MDTVELDFKKYVLEGHWNQIPTKAGIYCVYSAKHGEDAWKVGKLLYIGKATDLNTRVNDNKHEGINASRETLVEGMKLCLSYAEVDGRSLERVEAAMIFHHQPRINEKCKRSYTHQTITINISGKAKDLDKSFTVEKDDSIGGEIDILEDLYERGMDIYKSMNNFDDERLLLWRSDLEESIRRIYRGDKDRVKEVSETRFAMSFFGEGNESVYLTTRKKQLSKMLDAIRRYIEE